MLFPKKMQTSLLGRVEDMKNETLEVDAIVDGIGKRDELRIFCEGIKSRIQSCTNIGGLEPINHMVDKYGSMIVQLVQPHRTPGVKFPNNPGSDINELLTISSLKSVAFLAEARKNGREISDELRRAPTTV